MKAIVEDVRPTAVHVMYFHGRVERYDRFEQDEELVMAKVGSGGTAFSPIWAKAIDEGIDPVCCIVLTDLQCYDFGEAPDYPVMWLTTDWEAAPFGEVLRMPDGDQ